MVKKADRLVAMNRLRMGLATWIVMAMVAFPPRFAHAGCRLPWIFFDLGANTIIDTNHDTFNKIRYMPGAHAYLQDLRAKGYHLGLLVNVPEKWGKTQEEKLKTTKATIAETWADSIPMDWAQFDLGVSFPPTDAQRKPAPYLFDLAVARAAAAGCDTVYQTTLPDEVPAAYRAGMVGIRLGTAPYDGQFYYPERRLRIRDFSIVHWFY
jgi:hypothetical protein